MWKIKLWAVIMTLFCHNSQMKNFRLIIIASNPQIRLLIINILNYDVCLTKNDLILQY